MNEDLRMRLSHSPTSQEERFFDFLAEKLVELVKHEDTVLCIEVRHINEPDDDTGFVDFDGEEFRVVLESRLDFGSRIDYLLHELAHVGSWFVNEENDHGPHFGIEYARLYTKYLELYEEFWS